MKAVNLIPADQRRGSGSAPPYGVYALLGGLAVLLLAVVLLVSADNQVKDRRAELDRVTTQDTAATQQAKQLEPYTAFAKLQQQRLTTVKQLASTRFQWSRAFDDVAHVIGTRVWLTGITGTVAPGVEVEDSAVQDTQPFRTASPNPALEIGGCARTNKDIVALLSRLRAMQGVQRVTLVDATKADTAQASTGSDSGSSDSCGSVHMPDFNAVVFYAPLERASASPQAGDATTATASTTTSSSSSSSSSP